MSAPTVDLAGSTNQTDVIDRRSETISRFGLGTAAAFVVLLAISFSVAPVPPGANAATETIRAYFMDHAAGVRAYALVQSLAASAFLLHTCWLAATVRSSRGQQLAGDVVLGAGILTLAASLTGAAVSATLAFGMAPSAEPALLRGLRDLGDLALNVGDPMVALLVGVHTVAAFRRGLTPRWIAGLGAVTAAAWAIGSGAVVVTNGPLAGSTGPYGMTIVALLAGWMLANATVLRQIAEA